MIFATLKFMTIFSGILMFLLVYRVVPENKEEFKYKTLLLTIAIILMLFGVFIP